MSRRRPRVFGTTVEAIGRAEASLRRLLPASFSRWLIENNGHTIAGVTIFPVLDDRDPRSTWDSIDRRFREDWAEWLANFEDEGRTFEHLLPFADYGSGDFYCFDYSSIGLDGEPSVVRWSHETGDTDLRALSFPEFERKMRSGDFKND